MARIWSGLDNGPIWSAYCSPSLIAAKWLNLLATIIGGLTFFLCLALAVRLLPEGRPALRTALIIQRQGAASEIQRGKPKYRGTKGRSDHW